MRLGVIDIGSNTANLLIVDAHHGAKPLPAASHKAALRLSEHLADDGSVRADGVADLVDFVRQARHLAEEQGAEELLGFATSAIRESANGPAVLQALNDASGLDIQVLSGVDEARLTFLAARRWLGWSAGTLLLLDIGGGSLELGHGMDEEPDAAVSVPLGAGRVTRNLLPGDPPSPEVVREARKTIRATLAAEVRPIVRAGAADHAVGTSKTFRSLARLTGAAPSADGPYVRRVLNRDALGALVDRLARMPVSERVRQPGVSVERAPQVLAGALVAEAAMDLLRLDTLEICPWALREGVILRRLEHLAG
ncbi:MAG: Ppx/GppA family phosphatase [Tetrasphaera jenkinsii]|nr:Ppx/GppA family phosphatase [Tetrasphaera jenkinsii]